MLDSDLDIVQNALRVKAAKIESKSIKSVRSRVTTINEHAPVLITMDQFKDALRRHFSGCTDNITYELTGEDCKAIDRLVREKYGTWEWNYGKSPACTIRRDHRFPGGLITVFMEIEDALIRSIHIYGDFFGSREIGELENALTGMPLDENLIKHLSGLPVSEYIHGMTAQELALIIR